MNRPSTNPACCRNSPPCPGCPARAATGAARRPLPEPAPAAPSVDAGISTPRAGARREGGKRRIGRVLSLLLAASAIVGCQSRNLDQPPTVRFGDEACDECRMIISDGQFAAALVTRAGDALKFDDIGCLIEHEANRLRPDVAYWVCDSQTGEWLNAREAVFIHSPSVASPMGYGLEAHSPGARLSGRKLRFEELPGFLTERARTLATGRAHAGADPSPPPPRRNDP